MLLEGIFPAVTTPFYPDGRLYLRKLEHNIERYSRTLAAGLVILGSTGEAVMLSDDETRDILRHASGWAAPDKVLVAGIGRESLIETLRLAEYAASHRYDAVVVRTPHYYGPLMRAAELLAYYRTLADQSPLPVILYSIPKFTHLEIPVEVVAELAQHPNIIAIKDSSGSLERLSALIAATRNAPKRSVFVTSVFAAYTNRMMMAETEASAALAAELVSIDALGGGSPAVMTAPRVRTTRTREIGFQVLSGSAENLLGALEAGVSGAILAFAAPVPQACQEVYTAWKENDSRIAAEKQQRLIAASRLVAGKYGIPGLKHACDLNGYYGGVPRNPLLTLSAEQKAEVAAAMADLRN
jgi:dihydrodipicolinate synthase/N-acetylneuraminate lyase